MSTIRVDIQALRGLAVAFVVLEHLSVPGFTFGFLGVDIFFVISGFLITSIVSRELGRNSFSFTEFYLRRAKRLLPASFVTIVATLTAAKFFLPPVQIESLKEQVFGALTFTTNFVLLSQAGYFDIESTTKPLLHLWSLAIEEQFYFVVPALLVLTPSKHWKKTLCAIAVLSFAGCLYLAASNPSAAFYLLPTRAWELLLGSIASMIALNASVKGYATKLAIPALAVILASPFLNTGLSHPGLDALIVCIATSVIVIANHSVFSSEKRMLFINRIGDISYSLYLVHWPMIAFVNASSDTEAPAIKAALLAASLITAVAMNRLVEEPFRKMRYGVKPSLVVFPALTIAVFGLSHTFLKGDRAEHINKLLTPNYGLDRSCDMVTYTDLDKCKTSSDPSVFVRGDSYARHNIPGLTLVQKIDLRQATRSACAPFLNTALNTRKSNFEDLARKCIAFNDSALDFISKKASISTVILAGSYWQYTSDRSESFSIDPDGKLHIEKSSPARAMKDMQNIVTRLKSMGKEVIVISPPPSIGKDILSCMQSEIGVSGGTDQSNKCSQDKALYKRNHKHVIDLMAFAQNSLGVRVINLADFLCDDATCKSIIDGVPVYRDAGHLTTPGSVKLYQKMPNILTDKTHST